MPMTLLKAEFQYYPYSLPVHKWAQTNYWCDQPAMNLLWLVHPLVDSVADKRWQGDAISAGIATHLALDTRALLQTLRPLDFMKAFERQDHGDWLMTESWPQNYMATMFRRAREAEARLGGTFASVTQANVIRVDFRRRA